MLGIKLVSAVLKCILYLYFHDYYYYNYFSSLPFATIFGGCGAFKCKDFEEINGMSNLFFGWGGEDNDLYQRFVQFSF